jgi:hypothetical protein
MFVILWWTPSCPRVRGLEGFDRQLEGFIGGGSDHTLLLWKRVGGHVQCLAGNNIEPLQMQHCLSQHPLPLAIVLEQRSDIIS